MTAVIADLKVLESKVDHFFLRNPDSSKIAYRYLQHGVFQKHKTDSATYYESYEYYLSRKNSMLEILENASKLLEISEDDLQQKVPVE